MKVITFVATLVVLGGSLLGQNKKKSVAVEEFKYSTVVTDVQLIFGNDVNVGKGISSLMVTRITQGGKLTAVERQRVGEVLGEQDFGASGRVKKGTQARIGQIRGADFILMGDIVAFGRDDQRKGARVGIGVPGVGVGVGGRKFEGKQVVVIDFRLVDAETSEVVAAGEARGESSRVSKSGGIGVFVGGIGVGGVVDFRSANFAQTIIGEAVIDACNKLAEQLNEQASGASSSRSTELEAVIAAVDGNQVYLNMGTSSGVQPGDRFEVSHVVKEILDPVTKEVLDKVTRPIGFITISAAREKTSSGTFQGSSIPAVGDRAERK
jgi:curli biogenesis system outer membrane secretion channel CsgG